MDYKTILQIVDELNKGTPEKDICHKHNIIDKIGRANVQGLRKIIRENKEFIANSRKCKRYLRKEAYLLCIDESDYTFYGTKDITKEVNRVIKNIKNTNPNALIGVVRFADKMAYFPLVKAKYITANYKHKVGGKRCIDKVIRNSIYRLSKDELTNYKKTILLIVGNTEFISNMEAVTLEQINKFKGEIIIIRKFAGVILDNNHTFFNFNEYTV